MLVVVIVVSSMDMPPAVLTEPETTKPVTVHNVTVLEIKN